MWGKKRCNTGKEEVTYVMCEMGKGIADRDGGVQNEFKGHNSRPRSADRDSGMYMEWSTTSRVSSAE